ncbi:MAG: sugar transferase [Lachnospiraceae bacterium]
MNNKKRETYKRIFMFWSTIVLVAAQTAMFAWLWYRVLEPMMEIHYYRRGNWAVIAIYCLFTFLFSKVTGAFKVGYLRNLDVLYSQILAIVCTNGVTYLQVSLIGKWAFTENIWPMAKLTVADLIVGILWIIFTRWVYAKLYPPHQMLLIHGDISPKALIRKLNTRGDKYSIKETVHINEGTQNVLNKIKEAECVMIGDIPSHERNLFLKYCFKRGIRCYCVPKISDIMITSSTNIELFDTPLMLFRNRGLTVSQTFVKRCMDIVISLIGCILASPFMLIIAIAIKLYDHGPVFYSQERVTKNGEVFQIYKFRSMVVDSEKYGARLAAKHDDRITPVGKVIRRLHVDELPQLFNILKGDMSFVGPRPEREEIYQQYEKVIPEFRYRLKMKAGLTGYAQVYGNYHTVPYDKLKLDLTYIENYSVWLDIKLILLTVKILFQKDKSEGVDDNQTTALKKEEGEKGGN